MRRRWLGGGVLLLVLGLGVPLYQAWDPFFPERTPQYDSLETHFKYGSIGNEDQQGMPYWLWLVLPRVFSDKLPGPGGYTALGLLWEKGQELPVGFSRKEASISLVSPNCALCHTSSYRRSETDGSPVIVSAGAGQRFDAQGYLRFLFECASDPRFNADVLLPELEKLHGFSWVQKQLYRYVVIPKTREALLKQKQHFAWMDTRPAWGPGRAETMNPAKFGFLRMPDDGTIGTAEVPALWGMKARPEGVHHWDGLNPVLREIVLSAAIENGTSSQAINRREVGASLQKVQDFLLESAVPAYPFTLDPERVKAGAAVYAAHCASCHGAQGQGTPQLIPIAEVGTDAHRWDSWSEEAAQRFNDYTRGESWKLSAFRKTAGYLAVPLTGLWLHAPYLHNGSVPSLEELLQPPAKRPTSFYRGNDVYDPARVGFVSDKPSVQRGGVTYTLFRYDTSLPGNGNGGHLHGVELPADSKLALLEFLKTL
ncbi:hypothetical protein BO221_43150 [Archangium sp. Cb G35]|nr:hypothetical protein BO221_43150 [Archangium sp. Cb G35]